MNILVNGEESSVSDGSTVAELVDAVLVEIRSGQRGGVAVAVNEAVVPRAAWTDTALKRGDRVEILTAVQGG
jgi:sulfur carrier protein